jgi:ABC-2 type transport system ATP-binding protein
MTKAFKFIDTIKKFSGFKLGPLNLELDPGTVLGYIGPNGAGKSTTMHCMVGLLKTDSGEIEIFGKYNDPNNIEWKYDIGYVGDKHIFYENWSCEKNLKFLSKFYPDWSDKYVLELAKRFEIPMKKRAKDLSSGNRVKLSLISALAHMPKLLILDEPTAGLDPVVRSEFLDILFEVVENGERAIFYSTHNLADISRIADELAFIDNGEIKLKTLKDDLIEKWRSISFKSIGNIEKIDKIVNIQKEGNESKVISSDYELTIKNLRELGAENIQESRMNIDEIAVWILKNNKITKKN